MDQFAFLRSIHSLTAVIIVFNVGMAFEIYLGFSVRCIVHSAKIEIKDEPGLSELQQLTLEKCYCGEACDCTWNGNPV
jgi:hypothetical protein